MKFNKSLQNTLQADIVASDAKLSKSLRRIYKVTKALNPTCDLTVSYHRVPAGIAVSYDIRDIRIFTGNWHRTQLQIQTVAVFYFIHYEGRLNASYRIDSTQDIDNKLIVNLHIRGIDFQDIVKLTWNIVALPDLRNVLDDIHKIVRHIPAHLLQLNGAENLKAEIQFLSIQNRHIFLYVPGLFQFLQSLENRSRGQIYLSSKFLGSETCILLKGSQDIEVIFIESELRYSHSKIRVIIRKIFCLWSKNHYF